MELARFMEYSEEYFNKNYKEDMMCLGETALENLKTYLKEYVWNDCDTVFETRDKLDKLELLNSYNACQFFCNDGDMVFENYDNDIYTNKIDIYINSDLKDEFKFNRFFLCYENLGNGFILFDKDSYDIFKKEGNK